MYNYCSQFYFGSLLIFNFLLFTRFKEATGTRRVLQAVEIDFGAAIRNNLYSIPMCWLLCTTTCFYNPELQFHICRDWIQKQLSVIFELCIRLCFMCPTNTLPGKTLSSRKGKLSALNYGFGIRDSLDDSQTVQTLEAFVEILDSVPPASSPYPTGSRSYEQSDVGSSHQIDMGW